MSVFEITPWPGLAGLVDWIACDGEKVEQGPGSFNYLPAKMVHEAWTSAGSVVFITVDRPWDVNWVDGAPTVADLSK